MLFAACGTETSPLHDQGDIPEELVVSIDSQGSMYILAEVTGERLDEEESRKVVAAFLSDNPGTMVLVHADPGAPSEAIARVLAWLDENGAGSIGIPMRIVQ